MSTVIYVRSQFEAFHRWKDAPDDVGFLRHWHRHMFHVKVTLLVSHNNRAVEFFQFKRELDAFIGEAFTGKKMEASCEQMAQQMLLGFSQSGCIAVEVSEDNENGAIVTIPDPK